MKIELAFGKSAAPKTSLFVLPAFSKSKTVKGKQVNELVNSHWPKEVKAVYGQLKSTKHFEGAKGQLFSFSTPEGVHIMLMGLGEKSKVKAETLRKEFASLYKRLAAQTDSFGLCLDSFNLLKGHDKSAAVLAETLTLAAYQFNKYLPKDKKFKLQTVYLLSAQAAKRAKVQKAVQAALHIAESVNYCRDLVNEPPNVLNSEAYAKVIEKDVRTALKGKGVKIKVLGKPELKKEKMGMFLSVNNGSAFGPRLVHLSYTPKRSSKRTKHIAFVGKGLTFDTGGYSLKPGAAMINMKFDMAGSATVYATFRAAVLLGVPCKVSCFLGMTDNAINSLATMPDSIVTARNGKTVEILNTDAEGRLVLGDVLSYACDQKPDAIIDAATLTGAMLVALGTEVCGVFSNDDKLAQSLLKAGSQTDEYVWHMPIVDEFRSAMKGSISDLKNISDGRWGGSSKAAAFLENFVSEGTSWAHLDIAGIGDSQSHLSYCPSKGASGLIVRTLVQYLKNV